MPLFELQTPDGETFEVEAPDENSALEALGQIQGGRGPMEKSRQPQGSGFNQFKSMMDSGQIAKPTSRYPDLVAGGLAKGVMGLAELPGSMRDLAQKGTVWAAGKLGASPETQDAMTRANESFKGLPYPFGGTMAAAPSAGTLQPGLEKFTGPLPKPQGMTEELVDRAATMAPGMALGPGGIGPKAGAWLGATLGGYGGRKLAENTGNKKLAPYADFAGTLLGGAAGLTAAEKLAASAATKEALAKVPATAQIAEKAQQLYKQADDIGLAVKPEGYSDMIDNVFQAAGDDGFFAANHPKLANAFNEMEKWRGSPMTLDKLQQLRSNIKSAYTATEPDQNRVMQAALNKFDDYMENLRPDQVISGDTRAATILLKEANPTWAKYRKAELFDNITQNARNAVGANYTEAGFQTAVRQQLRAVAKDNFKRFKFLNPGEREQILQVVNGGGVENFLRRWGGFSLLSQTGGIKSSGAAYVAGLFGGPPAAAGVGGILAGGGTVARPISTLIGKNNFNMLKATVRNGGPLVQNAAPSLLSSQVPIQGLLRMNTLPQVRGANH